MCLSLSASGLFIVILSDLQILLNQKRRLYHIKSSGFYTGAFTFRLASQIRLDKVCREGLWSALSCLSVWRQNRSPSKVHKWSEGQRGR